MKNDTNNNPVRTAVERFIDEVRRGNQAVLLIGGPPASGKSTLARKVLKKLKGNLVDVIDIDYQTTSRNTKYRWRLFSHRFRSEIASGKSLIAVATFGLRKTRMKYRKLFDTAKIREDAYFQGIWKHVSKETSIKRALLRKDHPDDVSTAEVRIEKWFEVCKNDIPNNEKDWIMKN
jgi:predicted kinase